MPLHNKTRFLLAAGLLVSLSACIFRVRQVEVEPLSPQAAGTQVSSPVKAHLFDGSTVVYEHGVTIGTDTLYGAGARYDLRLDLRGAVERLPLDSVVGMENFRTSIDQRASVQTSLAVTGAVVGLVALMCAANPKTCFGSCPTFYSDSAGVWLLEAEGFSYSIAPLFESRDLDRLSVTPDAAGEVRLEVRNEALETHYLNHLELLAARHTPDERVVPDAGNRPVALRTLHPPVSAVDREGRDVLASVAAADTVAFASAPQLLADAREDDMRDHLDLVFPAPPPGTDSVAVVLRLRNSLLTTVLLYDVMLGSAGARALDWLGSDIEQVGHALELGQWYNRHMGLRILVWEDGVYRPVARLADTGPIAWKEVAAMVPAPTGDSLRVRLSFVTDSWRIDHVAVAVETRRPEVRTVSASRLTGADGQPDDGVLPFLLAPDERYLETRPGQRFTIHFDTGIRTGHGTYTFLLASQGYYTEWIRQGWIRQAGEDARPFRPSDELLFEALQRWHARQDSFEAEFYATRIPVR